MSNSVDPDEMAHYELSYLDLCCLQMPIIIACGSEGVKINALTNLTKYMRALFSSQFIFAENPEFCGI